MASSAELVASLVAQVATPTTRRMKRRRNMLTMIMITVSMMAMITKRKKLISVTSMPKRSLPSEQVKLNDQIV